MIPEHRRAARIRALTSGAFVALLSLVASSAIAQETLPTPYTAEQIRDVWRPGFAVWTETTTAEGTQRGVTTVASWSPDRASICERPLDENNSPTGPKQCSDVAWEDLRKHALFPAQGASRSRVTESTPLGELEGWLYEVLGESGSTQFFFADSTPGIPAVMRQIQNGETILEMQQTRRQPGRPAKP